MPTNKITHSPATQTYDMKSGSVNKTVLLLLGTPVCYRWTGSVIET